MNRHGQQRDSPRSRKGRFGCRARGRPGRGMQPGMMVGVGRGRLELVGQGVDFLCPTPVLSLTTRVEELDRGEVPGKTRTAGTQSERRM